MRKKLLLLFTLIVSAAFLMILIISAKSKENQNEGNNFKCETPLKVIEKNIKTDFSAKGDNRHDDSFSFLAASDWLNKNCSDSVTLKLFIPSGTYIVGLQMEPGQIITNP